MGKASGDREASVAGGRLGDQDKEGDKLGGAWCLSNWRVLQTAELLDSSDQGMIQPPCILRVLQKLLETTLGGRSGGQAPA